MIRNEIFGWMSLALFAGLPLTGMADTNSSPAQPAISDRPVVVPPATAPDRANVPGRPERPAVPGKPTPSKDMKDLVRDFQTARESFRKQQTELNRQLKSANEEQRSIIRGQIQENLRQWLEEQRARTEELREQAHEMGKDLRGLRDVIDSGASPKDQGPRGRP
jgi:TolA-binding protein